MIIGLRTNTVKFNGLLFFTFVMFNLSIPLSAYAVQWNKLAQTNLYHVAIEMDSIQKKPDGNIAIWFRFTPKGTRQRIEAANEYTKKDYFQHLEYYEISCIEQSATLRQIDILAKNGRRIDRITSFNSRETIIPGSALDMAAAIVCPEPEPVNIDDGFFQDPSTLTSNDNSRDLHLLEDKKNLVTEALIKTKSEPENHKAWAELGNAYYDLEMPKEAIEAYNMALNLKPNDIEILNDQGAMFRLISDFPSAINNYQLVLTADPNNLESLYSLGYIYAIEINKIKEAVLFWKRFLEIDNSSEIANQLRQYIDKYGK